MKMRIGVLLAAVGFFTAMSAISVRAESSQEAPDAKDIKEEKAQLVTEGEFARWLVQVLGLARFLPAAPTDAECFSLLLNNGVAPKDGWKADNVVTMGSLARIVVQAMNRQSEVLNPDDDQSWIDFLKSIGIEFATIGEAVDQLKLLDNPLGQEAVVVSTDPLGKRAKMRPIDEQQLGVDLQPVILPPRPMTPN